MTIDRIHRVRACSGYFAGTVPVLSWRFEPADPQARRHPSDMSDAEWALTEPALPAPAWLQGKGGRLRNGAAATSPTIRYLVKEGIQWRAMPCDLPPWADRR